MGEVLPSTQLGRWHLVWATRSCVPFHQSWAVFSERGEKLVVEAWKYQKYLIARRSLSYGIHGFRRKLRCSEFCGPEGGCLSLKRRAATDDRIALLWHQSWSDDSRLGYLLYGLLWVRPLSSTYNVLFLINMISGSRYGLVGLLRPLTVYPSEMVYWFVGAD